MSNSDTIMKDGKPLSGNAATLHIYKLAGGKDQYEEKLVDDVSKAAGRAAVAAYKASLKRPALKVVKGGKS